MTGAPTETGWTVVAETDGSARLLGALAAIDTEETYTRSELAEAAGVPLKTLYLDGAVETCADLGVLERVDAGGEARYRVAADSEVRRAARAFGQAVHAASESGTHGTDLECEPTD